MTNDTHDIEPTIVIRDLLATPTRAGPNIREVHSVRLAPRSYVTFRLKLPVLRL